MVEGKVVQLGWRVRLVAGLSTLGSRRAELAQWIGMAKQRNESWRP